MNYFRNIKFFMTMNKEFNLIKESELYIKYSSERILKANIPEMEEKAFKVAKKLDFFSNIETHVSVEGKKVSITISVIGENLVVLDKAVLSKTTKLGGVFTFSLLQGETCPGAKKSEICKKCYAKRGNYLFDNVTQRRNRNLSIIRQDNFIDEMKEQLINFRFFRWFDSGDIPSVNIAKKIIKLCEETPWVTHWIPTNSWDIPKLIPYIKMLEALPNTRVRYSSRFYNKPITWNLSSFVYTKELLKSEVPEEVFFCPSPKQEGQCKSCRACFDEKIKIIAYKKH